MAKRRTRSEASKLAKGRGATWEREVAKLFGGVRKWAGPGSDVEAGDLVIECKSQQDYSGLTKLIDWISQAEGYSANWLLIVRLGLRATKRSFAVMNVDRAAELLRKESELDGHVLPPVDLSGGA